MAEHDGFLNKAIIEKLTHENYDTWHFRMMMLLVDRGLWELVNGSESCSNTASASEKEKFKRRSQKALALIGLHVGDEYLPHILNAKDAKKLWDDLEKFHEEKSKALRIQLRRQLQRVMTNKDESVAEFIKRLKTVANKLKAAGYVTEEDEVVCVILSGLRKEFNTIVSILESSNDDLTVLNVTPKLLRHEAKLEENDTSMNSGSEEKAFNIHETRRCFICKKRGHIARNCRRRRNNYGDRSNRRPPENYRKGERLREENAQVAFFTIQEMNKESEIQNKWIMDSGASSHMTCNKNWLKGLRAPTDCGVVKMEDGHRIEIKGVGEVEVDVVNGGRTSTITLKNVLFVPNLSTNLISVPRTTAHGMAVNFVGNHFYIQSRDEKTHAQGIKSDNLYYLLGKTNVGGNGSERVLQANEESAKLWHYRFGHLNYDDLKKLSNGMVLGIKIKEGDNYEFCESCIKGKGHRSPIPKLRSSNTKEAFELLHSDFCGPISPISVGGAAYLLTLTDDYSRHSWVRFLKRKSDAAENVKHWILYVENQYKRSLKVFRSDRGGEYLNNELDLFFKSKGIKQEATVSYTPQQNGIAERLNRTLMEKARSMLSHLPIENKKLWAEAIAVANYVRNRSPTKSLNDITPFEMLNERKPNVSHLTVFGAKAYVHFHKEQGRKKLDSKVKTGIFVGYSTKSKGYRIYNVQKGQVSIHRDVTFNESVVLSSKGYEENNEILQFTGGNDENTATNEDDSERIYPLRERKQTSFYKPEESSTEMASVAYTEPESYHEAIGNNDREIWMKAMDEEYESLIKNKTWTLCELPIGRKAIKSKWVFKLKRSENGKIVRHKARLVAKGCTQREGIDYDETFAPVSRFNTLRVLLSIAAGKDLEIYQVDIKKLRF